MTLDARPPGNSAADTGSLADANFARVSEPERADAIRGSELRQPPADQRHLAIDRWIARPQEQSRRGARTKQVTAATEHAPPPRDGRRRTWE
jgi:hypothetical protein